MKKYILITVAALSLTACNNKSDSRKAEADTLLKEVMHGHDIGMAKTPKISKTQQEVNRLLDSIAKLPAASQQALASFKAQLDSLNKDLEYADFAMNKWMEEFNYDTASSNSNMERRIEYLLDEKMKVTKVKDAILNSLARADTVLKSKF